jgi:hypothetical protein
MCKLLKKLNVKIIIKVKMNYTNTKFITKKAYDSIEECECGGPIFKYQDTARNVFVVKCGYFKKVLDIDKITKRKVWVVPKKVACDWICTYHGERPVFSEINKKLSNFVEKNVTKDPHRQLEEKLKLLFRFLYLSTHSTTLDEINVLVLNNLLREPRKTYYYPSIGHFMRISHMESFEDYEKRIFSKKIIDQSYLNDIKLIPKQPKRVTEQVSSFKNHYKNESLPIINTYKYSSQFIIADSDSEKSDESEHGESSDSESEEEEQEDLSDKEISDFESVFDDTNELVDDVDDYEEEPDYQDD